MAKTEIKGEEGDVVYDTESKSVYVFTNGRWVKKDMLDYVNVLTAHLVEQNKKIKHYEKILGINQN